MENLVLFYPEGHQAHFENGHPERPERVEVVRQTLDEAGWWAPFPKVEPFLLPIEFIQRVHSASYLSRLEAACQQGARLDLDTYTTPASWRLALNAIGGSAAVAERIWRNPQGDRPGVKGRGFALSRPPGHHAERARGMGFCLLNNVAAASEYVLSFPMPGVPNARRVAIVDLDLHHGNGTQDIFWQREDVLFISTHQAPLYPGTGALDEIGAGDGLGFTVNLPFPPATGDSGYQAAMEEVILPLLARYQPEMLLVSLGFDTHWRDPLGHILLTAGGIGRLVKSLVDWADGDCQSRIMLIMEGGYDTLSVAACARATAAALLGENIVDGLGGPNRVEGKSWQPVVRQAKAIWQL